MIYFIQQGGMGAIKIGYTEDENTLETRLSSLQSASPIELVLIGVIAAERRNERLIHSQFADFRIRGEWFVPVSPLLSFISLNAERVIPRRDRAPTMHNLQGSYLICPRCGNDGFLYIDCNYGTEYYFSEACEECGLWFDGKLERWLVDCENWETAWRCKVFEPPATGYQPKREEVETE